MKDDRIVELVNSAPIKSSIEIDEFLDSLGSEDLSRFADQIGGQIGKGLRLRAQKMSTGKQEIHGCTYLDQHINLVHNWHSDVEAHSDLN